MHQPHVSAVVQQVVNRRRFAADATIDKTHELSRVRLGDRLGTLLPCKLALVVGGHLDHAAEGEPDAEKQACQMNKSHILLTRIAT